MMPNPWDAGSARILEAAGYSALATTSSGFALTKGRKDYDMTRDGVLAHAAEIVSAVDIPVSADLENGWGDDPHDTAKTIRGAIAAGLAGGSIEDFSGDPANPIYDQNHAAERIAAAASETRNAKAGFVLTARAEAYLHGEPKLDDVIKRLLQFEAAGADVLFAPGLPDLDAVRAVCSATTKPVSVLIIGGLAKCTLEELAQAGVARISIGGALAWSAYADLAARAALMRDGKSFNTMTDDKAALVSVSKALR